jgi:hypothetical protein
MLMPPNYEVDFEILEEVRVQEVTLPHIMDALEPILVNH